MNPRILLLLSLMPFVFPLIISIGAAFGIVPLSPGTSPRLPIISSCAFAFILSVVIWKWRSPEIQAKLRALSATHKDEKTRAGKLILAQSVMIVLFTFLGVGAGLFVLNSGQIDMSVGQLVALGILAALISMAAFFYTKKVQNMATKSKKGSDMLPGEAESSRKK